MVGRLTWTRPGCLEIPEGSPRARDKARQYWGHTETAACDNTYAKTASHVLCECEDSAALRPRCLGKHFMEPSDHEKIPLCKILYFVGDTGLLSECKRRGMHDRSENGCSARVTLRTHLHYTHNHTHTHQHPKLQYWYF
jgi:hypothetical protein